MHPIGEKTCTSNTILRERFDFDKWKSLHESDPQKFEIKRRIYIEQVLATTSERNQRRLKGIIFQVDAIRQRSNNPIKSCVDISQMMWDSFYQLHDLLNNFDFALRDCPNQLPSRISASLLPVKKPAKVIPFKKGL